MKLYFLVLYCLHLLPYLINSKINFFKVSCANYSWNILPFRKWNWKLFSPELHATRLRNTPTTSVIKRNFSAEKVRQFLQDGGSWPRVLVGRGPSQSLHNPECISESAQLTIKLFFKSFPHYFNFSIEILRQQMYFDQHFWDSVKLICSLVH